VTPEPGARSDANVEEEKAMFCRCFYLCSRSIVIASQRVGATRRPMTGSTKQSITQRKRMDCFVASLLAMTRKP
jgi:hypothetical protein